MRLIDADALLDEAMGRYCKECDKRRGIKNGKWRVIYEIGEAPCRACGIDDMKAELEDAPTIEERKWIPCSERLPEDDVEVFVYLFERQSPYIAWVEDCRWYTEDFEVEKENYPTAWMPLPEPYKEGNT